MKLFRRISAVLSAVAVTLALAVPAFAATVTFSGKDDIDFGPGSGYHATDLFTDFKDVMPGDTIRDTLTIKNSVSKSSYITVYLQAVPHNEKNPLQYSEPFENTDGKDQQNIPGQRDETIATMEEFLSQLTLTIKKGDTVLYEGVPHDPTGKTINLGKINKGRKLELELTLSVPISMGNEFALRVGEVDWVFYADIVEGKNLLQTGQLNWPIPVLGTLGGGLILLGVVCLRRKKKNG